MLLRFQRTDEVFNCSEELKQTPLVRKLSRLYADHCHVKLLGGVRRGAQSFYGKHHSGAREVSADNSSWHILHLRDGVV